MWLWLDMEMTGLDPEQDRILEMAMVITDDQLNEIAVGPELVIHQPDKVLAKMDGWNTFHHGESGLTQLVRQSQTTEIDAEAQTMAFIKAHFQANDRPILAGNSIHQDRRFICHYMPLLDRRLHYRMVDVSTFKEAGRCWQPDVTAETPAKRNTHRALGDIRESIAEMKFYKSRFFNNR